MKLTLIPRALGALAGIALAGSLVASARPSSEVPSVPATVSFSVPFTGELEADPVAPRRVLKSAAVRPEAPRASSNFELRNQTGEELAVGFKAESKGTSLDGLLRIRLSSAGLVLTDSTLQALRAGSEPVLVLQPGESAELDLEAWIPGEVETGYESSRANISLVPQISEAQR